MGCGRAAGVFPAVGVRKNLILCFAPAEDLIKDDRTERRGANTAHGKAAELESQIAGTRRERRRDGDQVLWV